MTVSPDDIAGGTLPPDASVWDRRMKALTMRNAGATFPRIAEQLGVSEMTVRNDIRKEDRGFNIVGNSYGYPKGYLNSGAGRLTAADRADIRSRSTALWPKQIREVRPGT